MNQVKRYRQLMDGCIVKRDLGRSKVVWRRQTYEQVRTIFRMLYEGLPGFNVERYNRYYGVDTTPIVEGSYDIPPNTANDTVEDS